MAGQVQEACQLLERSGQGSLISAAADGMDAGQCSNVYFFVKCLAFIELIAYDLLSQFLAALKLAKTTQIHL